MNGTNSVFPA